MAVLGEGGGQTIQRREAVRDHRRPDARRSSSLIREEVKRSGHAGMLPAGVVLTGGGARSPGPRSSARDVLEMPVRMAAPPGSAA